METVDYCPNSQRSLPEEKRLKYKVYETTKSISDEVNGQAVSMGYRLLFVWSESKAQQEKKTRERHVAKIRAEFEKIERNLNKYSLKTQEKIVERLELARGRYAVGEAFTYKLTCRGGIYKIHWQIDEQVMSRFANLEGGYLLKTDLDPESYPPSRVLEEYKQQIHVERRIGDMKGPLAIAPMFLEKPERIAGLMQILLWSLMVMALMERDVRKNLQGAPMYGIYPENRPCPAPTGRGIFERLSEKCLSA